jgi:hypothetical protein
MRTPILAFILILLVATPAGAQERKTTVRIENGSVYLDDRKLDESEYPSTLRTEGQHAQFRFNGEARFYMAGRPFTVRDGRIVEVAPDADDTIVVMLRSQEADAPSPATGTIRYSGPPSRTIGSFAKVLDARAARLEQLGEDLNTDADDERTITMESLHREAEEAAFMMRAFPRIEMKTYLDGIQEVNSGLHSRLMRELEMENESGMLAARILAETDQRRRADLERSLRTSLDEVFELKQQNRRDEIAQLERQLAELRTQLQAREANRKAIIERRMEDLLGPVRR